MASMDQIRQDFGHLDSFGRKKVFALYRRVDHLSQRIANNADRNLDYDKMELSALNWALKRIREGFW